MDLADEGRLRVVWHSEMCAVHRNLNVSMGAGRGVCSVWVSQESPFRQEATRKAMPVRGKACYQLLGGDQSH